jgi:hypothetical protein
MQLFFFIVEGDDPHLYSLKLSARGHRTITAVLCSEEHQVTSCCIEEKIEHHEHEVTTCVLLRDPAAPEFRRGSAGVEQRQQPWQGSCRRAAIVAL